MGLNYMSVIDDRMKVQGIEDPCFAGASIMLSMVSRDTYAALIMTGETPSDLILANNAH